MERIVLEVDDALAKTWNNSSKKFREEYENKITDVLREMKKKELKVLLDNLGKEAESNGMTEEILNELLSQKDE
jgi:hypothetical protein